MSTFLNQSSLSTTASNTYSRVSLHNSSSTDLASGEFFFGDFEYCGNYSCIQIATYSSNTSVSVRLAQSYTNVIGSAIETNTWTTTAGQLSQKIFYCSLPFYRIIVENTSGVTTQEFNLSTKLTLTAPQLVDDAGALIVSVDNFPAVQDVNIVSGGGGTFTTGFTLIEEGTLPFPQGVSEVSVPSGIYFQDPLPRPSNNLINVALNLSSESGFPDTTIQLIAVVYEFSDNVIPSGQTNLVSLAVKKTEFKNKNPDDSRFLSFTCQIDNPWYMIQVYASGELPVQATDILLTYEINTPVTPLISTLNGATSSLQQTGINNDSSFYTSALTDLGAIRFVTEEYLPLINGYVQSSAESNSNIDTKIVVCDTQAVNVSSGTIECYGKQSNFNFFPTPENNTINIYADETKGTNVVGGWNFVNTGTPSKINWYIYQAPNPLGNPTNAGQIVGSVSSVYCVVNQLSVTTPQNPYVIIYTRADSGTNAGPFKSRLVFQNTGVATTGIRLLYTGSDPTDVHPEITGANRINLPFILGASTKPLADAYYEEILSASLQTDSGLVAGSYNFTMAQFGIDWNPVLNILPIQDGKVQVETGVVTCIESSPTGAVTNTLGVLGDVVSGVRSTLQSITLSNVGGIVFSYVKLYNKATAPLATDTPVFTIPLNHDSVQQVECHSLEFPLGIGLRATLNFASGDTNAPSGTCYGTAFYTNIIQ